MVLHAFRHAESVGNINTAYIGGRSDHFELSPDGPAQAQQLGLRIGEIGLLPDLVCASPAVRAKETARIALDAAGLKNPIDILEGIHEVDQGEFTGKKRSEIWIEEQVRRAERLGKRFKAPGGESVNEAGMLFQAAIDTYIHNRGEAYVQPLVVFAFSHGLRLRSFASRIDDWSYQETINGELTPNTSHHIFRRQNGTWSIVRLGITSTAEYFDTIPQSEQKQFTSTRGQLWESTSPN